jgi:hypothetical protein
MKAMAGKRLTDNESTPNGNEPMLTYALTYKDVVDILTVIDHSACRELRIELGDFKLTVIKRGYRITTAAAGSTELDPGPRGKGISNKERR